MSANDARPVLGIIGGSGVYDIDGRDRRARLELEYGVDRVEMHVDAIDKGERCCWWTT
jgi:purine nucleoside phosphorylase